jgi:hypothetical protein
MIFVEGIAGALMIQGGITSEIIAMSVPYAGDAPFKE